MTTHLYVILGLSGSGRREILKDLIEFEFSARDPVILLRHGDDSSAAADETLTGLAQLSLQEWHMDEQGAIRCEADFGGARAVFFMTRGSGNPVDQLEALSVWIPNAGLDLARILTIVDCHRAYNHSELKVWFDACIHFSDAVLLTKREEVPNGWVGSLQTRYRKLFFPCLFELVKRNRVSNPAAILSPESRRMSLFFDDFEPISGEFISRSRDEEEDEVEEGDPPVDPYLERIPGGSRRIPLPDVRPFLGSDSG